MEGQWVVVTVLLLIGLILLRLWSKPVEKAAKWPPGPPKLPILGNFHQLFNGGNLLHHTIGKMVQEYGPVMTIWLGGWKPTIVVSDYELVREVLVTKSAEFGARDFPFSIKYLTANFKTVASADYGPFWHTLRKGLQNSSLNPVNISAQIRMLESEVGVIIDTLASEALKNGGVVSPLKHMKLASIRLTSRLCFGSEFNNEEFVQRLYVLIQSIIRQTRELGLSDLVPFTRHIPILGRLFHQTLLAMKLVGDLIRPFLHLSEPSTFLYFLKSQNLPEDIMFANVFELFLLSADSSANTTVWGLGYLIHNQGIQQKLYDEIKSICGEGRVKVTAQDLNKMEYIHAVAKETIRMKPIAPLGVPRKAMEDSTLMGYKIHKGTAIVLNLYQVLRDGKVWEEPERFMPERFLAGYGDEDRVMAMEKSFVPFGGGRRMCPGMELAKLMIPLALANLVGAYHWYGVDGESPDMSEQFVFGLMMKTPFSARIMPRKSC